MKSKYLILISCCFACCNLPAQSIEQIDRTIKATEFAIPSSPAFNMLNDNVPSRIQRYSSLHDFKVDWSIYNGQQQSQGINPGLAIEAQPIWMLFFDRAGAAKYRATAPLARTLSTMSFSLGTNITNENNWMAWGLKMNLYRQDDPLSDPKLLKTLEQATEDAKDTLYLKINELERKKILLKRRDKDYDFQYAALEDSIMEIQFEIQEVERAQSQRLVKIREEYIQKHWNSSYLDVAFGRLATFQSLQKELVKTIENPETGTDTTIFFNTNTLELKNEGWSAWLSGGIGAGANGLISGMVRYGVKPSALTGIRSRILSLGLNLRYGNSRYNVFIEGFYDDAKSDINGFPDVNVGQKFYMFTLGGDWRFSKNVMLSFGIRQTKDFDNDTYLLQPLFNVNCLMR